MIDEERRLWLVGDLECVMITCCAGAELQMRRIPSSPGAIDDRAIVLRELYPTKSDLYDRARELKAEYEEGAAYTALGEIDRQLPGLFDGNLRRGIAVLETGLKVVPNNPEIKTALAEAYMEANRKNEARTQLQEALQAPLNSARAPESRRAQERAQKLLKKLQTK